MTASFASDAPATASPATPEERAYLVAGMSCGHCEAAVTEELCRLDGVRSVEIDLGAKLVRVQGTGLDDGALRAAIDEAGYDSVPA